MKNVKGIMMPQLRNCCCWWPWQSKKYNKRKLLVIRAKLRCIPLVTSVVYRTYSVLKYLLFPKLKVTDSLEEDAIVEVLLSKGFTLKKERSTLIEGSHFLSSPMYDYVNILTSLTDLNKQRERENTVSLAQEQFESLTRFFFSLFRWSGSPSHTNYL